MSTELYVVNYCPKCSDIRIHYKGVQVWCDGCSCVMQVYGGIALLPFGKIPSVLSQDYQQAVCGLKMYKLPELASTSEMEQ